MHTLTIWKFCYVFLLAFLTSPVLAQSDLTDRLSPYGIAKPVVIVVGSPSKELEEKAKGFSLVDTQKAPAPVGFHFLTRPDEEPKVGHVGIHLRAGAALLIKKRTLQNIGSETVTLRLARSRVRPSRTVELTGKQTADYNELRRCAAERAAGSPWPAKMLGTPNVKRGTLVIIGGGGMPAEIAQRFFEAGGGVDGHFVLLPISMPDPIKMTAENSFLRRLGAKNITVLPYREQKELEDPKVLALLKKATGIWFGGGRQWNFMDAYEGTKLPELFQEVLNRGGVIGGSSAGATIQGDYLVRGAPAGPHLMICEGYERGLGFLPGVAIDQHFSARKRLKDMSALMKTYPQFLGIGIDEATALVVRGTTAEILGRGQVYFYDANKPRKEGDLDYEAYPAGTIYDLQERKVKVKTDK